MNSVMKRLIESDEAARLRRLKVNQYLKELLWEKDLKMVQGWSNRFFRLWPS